MRLTSGHAATLFFALFLSQACSHVCVHGKNWPFKIGTDPQAGDVSLDPVPTSIDELRAIPHIDRPPSGRIAPFELMTYSLHDVWFQSFQRSPDGDVHMVLADDDGHTMIAETPPPSCTDDSSPWHDKIVAVRSAILADLPPTALIGSRHELISLAGVGYIDSLHGQPGVAPNGIEIHPVLSICFGKGCALPE